jgi:2,3-bisphosphoglycerate-independent phosphoglycerate mutase
MAISSTKRKPHLLIILDGWGYSTRIQSNAIAQATTPVWDKLWQRNAHALISGSGEDVGLPVGQMGNSEVGHMNLGAGRVVNQDFTRITRAIEDGSFFTNTALVGAVEKAVKKSGAVHIFGLLSPGGVHSHEDHIKAAVDLAFHQGSTAVYLHAFLDGRDVAPRSAKASLEMLDSHIKTRGTGGIVSMMGRFYAMDRDNRWERIEAAYNTLVSGTADYSYANVSQALDAAYERGENDEFVQPTIVSADKASITINAATPIKDGDSIIFMNFRADRAREITRAFVSPDFDHFTRSVCPKLADFVMLTKYADDIDTSYAFGPQQLPMVLGEYLSSLNMTQLRIAETEKYAHVTFFFSGGIETPYAGEDRILIASPKVKTYDMKPEMSAHELTDQLEDAILSGKYDAIIVNYANGDMVGHTGNLQAAIQAVETIDHCLGRITAALEKMAGEGFITADHGNVEQMDNADTGQPHTAHTAEPVPFVYLGQRRVVMREGGTLSDVAPSLLQIMELPQPEEMTGKSIISIEEDAGSELFNGAI